MDAFEVSSYNLLLLREDDLLVLLITQVWDGEGNGTPLQYSCLGNPTAREAWILKCKFLEGLQFMGLQRVGQN